MTNTLFSLFYILLYPYWNNFIRMTIKIDTHLQHFIVSQHRVMCIIDCVPPSTNVDSLCVRQAIRLHDDVIKWKHFPGYWLFVRWIHRSPVNPPHKGHWRGDLMISLICALTNGWVNNRGAADLRRHRAYYDITVMVKRFYCENSGLCVCKYSNRLFPDVFDIF